MFVYKNILYLRNICVSCKPPEVERADATEVVDEKENMRPACKYPLYYYVAHAKEKVVWPARQGWMQECAVLAPAGVYTVTHVQLLLPIITPNPVMRRHGIQL